MLLKIIICPEIYQAQKAVDDIKNRCKDSLFSEGDAQRRLQALARALTGIDLKVSIQRLIGQISYYDKGRILFVPQKMVFQKGLRADFEQACRRIINRAKKLPKR